MGHPMGIELTRAGLLVYLANHYTTRGDEHLRDVLRWTSTHGYANVDGLTRTYINQLLMQILVNIVEGVEQTCQNLIFFLRDSC